MDAREIVLTADDCLGGNTSADEVTTDLTLPTKTNITVEDVTKI